MLGSSARLLDPAAGVARGSASPTSPNGSVISRLQRARIRKPETGPVAGAIGACRKARTQFRSVRLAIDENSPPNYLRLQL